MTTTERGYGRGLNALIPTGDWTSGGYREIAVDSIEPNTHQPRLQFDNEALEALANSIGRVGVLQPILVRQLETDRFELIAGERRWRAARRAGLATIPALVRQAEGRQALEEALLENIQREDLNPLEEAAAYLQLQRDFGLTQQAVANRVGRSRTAVANSTRLLQLPAAIQELVVSRSLSAGHARALLGVADAGAAERLARKVVADGWSVRQLEAHLNPPKPAAKSSPTAPKSEPEPPDDSDPSASPPSASALAELETLLAEYLETTVKVEIGGRKGRLTVEFADLDDLERIYHLVTD